MIKSLWLSIIITLLIFSIIVVLSFSLNSRRKKDIDFLMNQEAEKLLSYMERDLENRYQAMERMVDRWEVGGGFSRSEFLSDATNYIQDMPGFQAIEWVDTHYIIRWIVPLAGNEAAQDLDLSFEEHRRTALNHSREVGIPTLSAPVELVQGGKGFLFYFPIFVENEFQGFLLSVFKVQPWLDDLFSNEQGQYELAKYSISLKMDDMLIYQMHSIEEELGPYSVTLSSSLYNHTFVISCSPTEQFWNSNRNNLPWIVLIFGLFFSLISGFMVYLYQHSQVEIWQNLIVKETLKKEINQHKKTLKELEENGTRLTLATKAGKIGVWSWDISSDTLQWDSQMYSLYGIPDNAPVNFDTWRDALFKEDKEKTVNLLHDSLNGKALFNTEFRIHVLDGSTRYISSAAQVFRNLKGNPVKMIGVNWDITDRKNFEDMLATERRRLSDILDGTHVGTWEWNIQTGETVFNQLWADIIGYRLSELEPISIETWSRFAHPEDLEISNELLQKHFNGELDYYECQCRMKHKNGQWVWVLDRGKVSQWTDDGKPLLMSGTHQDITQQKLQEQQIEYMATHDALTGLPSLRLVKDRINMAIELAIRNSKHLAVLFIDLDGFKQVNDNYGHDAGDALLKEVAHRLQHCIRKTDTVGRIGGDEFLIILTELESEEGISSLAEKILESLSRDIHFHKQELKVGASIGISFFPISGKDAERLIKQADSAMYKVKKSGKNGYLFA